MSPQNASFPLGILGKVDYINVHCHEIYQHNTRADYSADTRHEYSGAECFFQPYLILGINLISENDPHFVPQNCRTNLAGGGAQRAADALSRLPGLLTSRPRASLLPAGATALT